MKKIPTLPAEYALVLQQIDEDGGDSFNDLVDQLSIDRARLAAIVRTLQEKGLLVFDAAGDRGFWLELSRKGERLMRYMWPESRRPLTAL